MLDPCSLSAMTGIAELGDFDCGEKPRLPDMNEGLFVGANVEIPIFFMTESPARGEVKRTCGEARLDKASLDKRLTGEGLVVEKQCRRLSLLGFAEEILMS